MNLSYPFIQRPIATSLFAVGLAFAGIVAFIVLPVAPLPQIDFPTISISANLPGGSPVDLATSVATPLERQLGHIAGITEMTSASTLGQSRITIQFDLSRNIDGAARDVQAGIDAALTNLPANLTGLPTYRKINPADAPVLILSLTSDNYSRGEMYDVASTTLAQRLSQVYGIGQVLIGGSSLPAVRVELNPTALNKYGISLNTVSAAIAAANVDLAKGQFTQANVTSNIYTNDQIFRAYQYKPLIIAYRNGNPVRLSDVGDVIDSVQDVRNAGLSNGKPAVLMVLFKEPGANVIQAVDNVEAILPRLTATLPAGINIATVMDRTTTIRAALHDVETTLLIAMVLVILVVYVFLGSVRTMLIPAVAVPLSLLGTFAVMSLLGFSLDNLSLMALTISTGFVVDDAVVVLENITRHVEMGKKPMIAALEGSKEVGFTVLSMSVSLVAVFIPILLMSGIVGRLLREFSLTLAAAVMISLVVSLTVTPTMCAWLLSKEQKKEESHNRYTHIVAGVKKKYAHSLKWVLDHPSLMLLLTLVTLLLNIYLFVIVPKGFFPQEDTGRISGSIQAEQDISFQAMEGKLQSLVQIVKNDPAVENVVGFLGGGVTNSGSMYITLKALAKRKISADQVIARLRKSLSVVMHSFNIHYHRII
jgi:multidrug efflux pump